MSTRPPQGSIRSAMISGSIWMIAMRWSMRGIGIVSTIILVRLLVPEDFGLVAMSALFISLIHVLTSFGVDMALIQRTDAQPAHYHTAWTIRLLQTMLVAAVVFGGAPFAADYFGDERLTLLMQVMSISILISGLENIGIVDFRKELEFSREFKFMVATKLGSFVATISLALILRNYWALAFGVISGRVIAVAMSYFVHPFRPRPSMEKFSDLWSFSQWMLLRNIGMYLRKQIDTFVIARSFDTASVGYYSVSKEVSELPTTEIIWPMARALFPGYAKLSHDLPRLGAAFRNVLSATSLIAIPTGVGIALVAEPLVALVFGELWLPVVPILFWLSLYGVVLTLSSSIQAPLIALGQIRRVTAMVWIQLIVTLPAIIYAAQFGELALVALAQLITALIMTPPFFYALISAGVVTTRECVSAVWRPVVSAGIMMMAVYSLPSELFSGPLTELIIKSLVGAIVFIGTELSLWILSGRPDGGERFMLELAGAKVPSLRRLAGGSR